MAADSDLELDIDRTVEGFINEVAPGSAAPAEPALDTTKVDLAAPAITSLAKPAVPGAVEPVPYPKSWKQDLSPHWEKIPRELQEYVSNVREKDYLSGLEQYKSGHTSWNEMNGVMQPYMARIQSLGMQPSQAIRALLNADWTLANGSAEQKLEALASICSTYGLDPTKLALNRESPYQTEESKALAAKFAGVEGTLKSFVSSQVAQQRSTIDKEVSAFAADPANPYFGEVADHIARLLGADRNLSLKEAYDQAVWANPTTRAKAIVILNKESEDKARKEREAAAETARKARVANLRGKPVDRSTNAAKGGWEESLPVTAAAISNRK